MKRTRLFFRLALAVWTLLVGEIATLTLQEKLSAIDSMIRLAQKKIDMESVGLAVGIVVDGEPAFAEGYGLRNHKDSQSRVTNRTIFGIGSCTKAFTTYAMDDLANNNGSISWSDLVTTHIPEFRMSNIHTTTHIRLRDLVTHVSGLPRHDMVTYASTFPRNELVSRMPHLPTSHYLRETYQYNNLMYGIAGIAMERATGESWEKIVSERVFKPLNMSRTFSGVAEVRAAQVDDIATPHSAQSGPLSPSAIKVVDWRELHSVNPAGGICSCAEDLTKWMRAQLRLSGRSKKMHASHINMPSNSINSLHFGYGLGWILSHYQGRLMVSHEGVTSGFYTVTLMFPEDKHGIVVLTNFDSLGTFIARLAHKIADILKNDSHALPDVDGWVANEAKLMAQSAIGIKSDNSTWSGKHVIARPGQYVGQYEHPGYGVVRVSTDGSKLFATLNSLTYTLLPKDGADFFSARAPFPHQLLKFECAFARDSSKRVIGLHFHLELTQSPTFFQKRAADDLYTVDYLRSFVGTFGALSIDMNEERRMLTATSPETSLTGTLEPFDLNWFRLGQSFLEFNLADGTVSGLTLHRGEMIFALGKLPKN